MIRGVGTHMQRVRPRLQSEAQGGRRKDFAVYHVEITLERARLTSIWIAPCRGAELAEVRTGVFWLLDGRDPIPLEAGLSWEMRDPAGARGAGYLSAAVGATLKLRAKAPAIRPPTVVVWFDQLERRDFLDRRLAEGL